MKKEKGKQTSRDRSNPPLRREAEAKLSQSPVASAELHAKTPGELIHELEVHQIELEMQNDELKRAQLELEESRDRYSELYEFAPVGYFTLAGDGRIVEVNLTGAALLDVPRQKLINGGFKRFVAPADSERWARHVMSVLQHEERQSCDLTLLRSDGAEFPAQLESIRIPSHGESIMFRTAVSDITERKLSEQELRLAATAFESQEALLVTDADGHILRVNRAFTELTGYRDDEVTGHSLEVLKSGRHDAEFYRTMRESITHDHAWEGEIWNRHKDGAVNPEWMSITAVAAPEGHVTHYICSLFDISQHKDAEEQIRNLAFYDPLTQLPNRRLLYDRLEQAFSASDRSGAYGAILFIDLDHFKMLNDTLGHDIGDLLLIQVADKLRDCVRCKDSVARLGGDEFVVILEELNDVAEVAAGQAEAVGEKIMMRLTQPQRLNDQEYSSTPSIGISLFKGRQLTIDELIKRADTAMYRAKGAGRNTLRFFDPAMQTAMESHIVLVDEIRHAPERHELQAYYQIQADGAGRIRGAELLLRWLHPTRGLILPEHFIPLAEECGCIVQIGLWVLESACAQLKAWETDAATRDLQLAINVNVQEFRQPDFVARVRSVLERTGANPARLKFELTETRMTDNIATWVEKIEAVKALGVGFSIDDFGTGYSSLSWLQRLPLDQLKIDRSFIAHLTTNDGDAVIVRTIIGMARTLGLDVIAEGVETTGQFEFLARHGCPAFQGYLFSPPMPLTDFECMVRQPVQ